MSFIPLKMEKIPRRILTNSVTLSDTELLTVREIHSIEATQKSVIRTLPRQGNMKFVLRRNEIVHPYLDQPMSCHGRVYIKKGLHRRQGISGPRITWSTGRQNDHYRHIIPRGKTQNPRPMGPTRTRSGRRRKTSDLLKKSSGGKGRG
ncbi:hypothetical protein BHE74_00054585 [Ensete ventricosum]|nr:hypothetical protein BHE74_00054585 [Ensete ventricosum]